MPEVKVSGYIGGQGRILSLPPARGYFYIHFKKEEL